jgi:DNA-binding MarR family transcriptional regulator
MQQLEMPSVPPTGEAQCAAVLIDVVPLIMRAIREEMRSHRAADLSVPQFRVLMFLNRRQEATLSQVAEHLGVTLPSASRMVDGLANRKLLTRRISASDRRYVSLAVTGRGRSRVESTHRAAQLRLAEMLGTLPAEERRAVVQVMDVLRPIFTPGRTDAHAGGRLYANVAT